MIRIALLLLLFAPCALAQSFEQVRDLLRRGDFAAAVQACETGLQKQPRDFQLWTLQGIALQGAGQNTEALTLLRRVSQQQPTHAHTQALLGKLYLRRDAPDNNFLRSHLCENHEL